KPGVLLLADYGFNTYSTLIETRSELIDKSPDLVQRFVDASIVGWYRYLYGDNAPGNAMIKKLNPEMTDELLAFSVAKMKEYGIVDSGDALQLGSGPTPSARWPGSSTRWDGACPQRPLCTGRTTRPAEGGDLIVEPRPYYHRFGWAYDLLNAEPIEARIQFVVAELERRGVRPPDQILDAGCGTGRYAIDLSARGFRVSGVDQSPE